MRVNFVFFGGDDLVVLDGVVKGGGVWGFFEVFVSDLLVGFDLVVVFVPRCF